MGIVKVAREKVGPSPIVIVEMGLEDRIAFPAVCPCCCAPTQGGAFIVARCEELPPVAFPACRACAEHTRVEGRVAGFVGPALFWLTVVLVAGFFFVRGVINFDHPEAGLGWRLLAGLSNLRFPFLSPIHFGVTVLGGGAVVVALLFLYKGVMHLCIGHLSKPTCTWFNQAARTEIGRSGEDGRPLRRFILENPAYADRFIQANGGEPNRR